LRILVVTNMYPPQHLGGNELSCRDMVRRWRARGHEVDVLTSDVVLHAGEVGDDPRVRRELKLYWDDHRILSPSLPERLRMERTNHDALQRALDRCAPDVVSVWHLGAMSFGLLTQLRRRDLPTVLVVCDDYLTYGPDMDAWTRAFRRAPQIVRRAAESIVSVPTAPELPDVVAACFNSEWIRDRALSHSRWQLDRTTVVYSGIEAAEFAPRPHDIGWNWKLVSVGRVEERKGAHVAIDALAQLPSEATLTVVGSAVDAYRDDLQRRIRERGLSDRVTFTGHLPRDHVAAAVREADAFVFPVVWDEPFGLVPVEAMATGVPVVGSATGGSAEFLMDAVNALVVPRGDAGALAHAITRLAADGSLRRTLVANGLRTASFLDNEPLCDALEDWHVAAAHRFADGEPSHRPRLETLLRDS
jgi:glycogen synthase